MESRVNTPVVTANVSVLSRATFSRLATHDRQVECDEVVHAGLGACALLRPVLCCACDVWRAHPVTTLCLLLTHSRALSTMRFTLTRRALTCISFSAFLQPPPPERAFVHARSALFRICSQSDLQSRNLEAHSFHVQNRSLVSSQFDNGPFTLVSSGRGVPVTVGIPAALLPSSPMGLRHSLFASSFFTLNISCPTQ